MTIKTFLTVLVVFFVIDLLWIGWVSPPYLSKMIKNITGGPVKFNIWAGLAVYILISLGITVFVLPRVDTMTDAFTYGALFGLVVYGVYDLTNMAIFSRYDKAFALADILWGVFVSAATTSIVWIGEK